MVLNKYILECMRKVNVTFVSTNNRGIMFNLEVLHMPTMLRTGCSVSYTVPDLNLGRD